MEHRVITDYTNVNLENVHLKVSRPWSSWGLRGEGPPWVRGS